MKLSVAVRKHLPEGYPQIRGQVEDGGGSRAGRRRLSSKKKKKKKNKLVLSDLFSTK